MDEGTAYLDSATEARILRQIRSMGITVAHAAHRQQVIDDADVVTTIGDMDVVPTESEQMTA